jgi:hypothetical protein
VPPAFAHRISLSAHQKAADYTLAKAKVSLIDITLSAAVLLCWTLLGGLDWLNRWLLEFIGPGLWQQLALLASFAVISALIELPLSLYQTFRLEQRFGFNQMTPGLWLATCSSRRWWLPSSACRWRPDSLAHGLGRAAVVALGLGRLDGVQSAADVDFPQLYRTAVQQVRAAGR